MTSIRDVAKIAGVSPATVSRVMNGTANVNEEKRQRVEAAIEKTGFCPNELARALYKKSSKIIGVIVPDIENPFFSELAKAVEDEAFQNGYRMLLCSSGNNAEKEMQNIQMLVQMKADGVIIMTDSADTGKVLKACQVPVVLVDRTLQNVNEKAVVKSDHYKGGYLAAEHLLGVHPAVRFLPAHGTSPVQARCTGLWGRGAGHGGDGAFHAGGCRSVWSAHAAGLGHGDHRAAGKGTA